MSADDDLLRASMRREDLEGELRTIETEIAEVRERGRNTMGILAPDDNVRLNQLLDDRDRTNQALSEARSEERFQRKRVELSRTPEPVKPSLTDWKASRDRESGERTRDDPELAREPDIERER